MKTRSIKLKIIFVVGIIFAQFDSTVAQIKITVSPVKVNDTINNLVKIVVSPSSKFTVQNVQLKSGTYILKLSETGKKELKSDKMQLPDTSKSKLKSNEYSNQFFIDSNKRKDYE